MPQAPHGMKLLWHASAFAGALVGCSRVERKLGCAAEARRGTGVGAELCAQGPRAREGGRQV